MVPLHPSPNRRRAALGLVAASALLLAGCIGRSDRTPDRAEQGRVPSGKPVSAANVPPAFTSAESRGLSTIVGSMTRSATTVPP